MQRAWAPALVLAAAWAWACVARPVDSVAADAAQAPADAGGNAMQDGGGSNTADAGTLLLGSQDGTEPFVELPQDAAVDLTHGPQGGYHVWLGVRASPVVLEPLDDALRVRYALKHHDQQVGGGSAYVGLENIRNGVLEQTGLIMFLEWGLPVEAWSLEPVSVEVTLETERQRVLGHASVTWRITCCEDLTGRPDAGVGDGG